MAKHNEIGNIGEEIAVRFLHSKGHIILDRNYRKQYGEIDIVSKKNNRIHIIEVKTSTNKLLFRHNSDMDTLQTWRPEEMIHNKKIHRLKRVISVYIESHNITD